MFANIEEYMNSFFLPLYIRGLTPAHECDTRLAKCPACLFGEEVGERLLACKSEAEINDLMFAFGKRHPFAIDSKGFPVSLDVAA